MVSSTSRRSPRLTTLSQPDTDHSPSGRKRPAEHPVPSPQEEKHTDVDRLSDASPSTSPPVVGESVNRKPERTKRHRGLNVRWGTPLALAADGPVPDTATAVDSRIDDVFEVDVVCSEPDAGVKVSDKEPHTLLSCRDDLTLGESCRVPSPGYIGYNALLESMIAKVDTTTPGLSGVVEILKCLHQNLKYETEKREAVESYLEDVEEQLYDKIKELEEEDRADPEACRECQSKVRLIQDRTDAVENRAYDFEDDLEKIKDTAKESRLEIQALQRSLDSAHSEVEDLKFRVDRMKKGF
jgi:archaellum component FlaC